MKVICGWCKATLKDGPPEPISHGLCARCSARLHAELDAEDIGRTDRWGTRSRNSAADRR